MEDTYVVRVYRRDSDNPEVLAGVVEEIGIAGNRAFNTLKELWEILDSPRTAVLKRAAQRV